MIGKVNNNKERENKIFISWSGDSSEKIARQLKESLEAEIFSGSDLTCFVSTIGISSGTNWWNKIKKELKKCKLGILCITDENIKAPWIYFEAGAMTARSVPTIPILFCCNIQALDGSPIKANQGIEFQKKCQFLKMIDDINREMELLPISSSQLEVISNEAYNKLKEILKPTLEQLKKTKRITEKHIYPEKVKVIERNTLYISAPMSSIDDKYYRELRENILNLVPQLTEIGFTKISSPVLEIESSNKFHGTTKSIKENFVNMKQVDCMIIIYPKCLPSSVLVEIGYGLALCKKMVIFYRDKLPFILEDAAGTISHIKTYKYNDFNEIENKIISNGMDIFEGGKDE